MGAVRVYISVILHYVSLMKGSGLEEVPVKAVAGESWGSEDIRLE